MRRFAANGTAAGLQFEVNTTTAGDQEGPRVAMDAAGRFVVTWYDTTGEDGSGAGVYARVYQADGNPATGEELVNQTTTNDQQEPAIAIDDAGDFVIAY